jgi:HEPN domain-containing protein
MIKQNDTIIADLKRELTTLQKASLLASKTGDYAKSAALASQAVQLSKAIAREEGLPPFDFFTADESVAA